MFDNNLLIAAATEKSNTGPVDISGVTWPGKDMFALASKPLLNNGIATFASSFQGKNYSDSGKYKDLGDWNFNLVIDSITRGFLPCPRLPSSRI